MKSSSVGKVRGKPVEVFSENAVLWPKGTRGGGGVLEQASCPLSACTWCSGTTMTSV